MNFNQFYSSDNTTFQNRLRAGVQFVDKMPPLLLEKLIEQYFKNLANNEVIIKRVIIKTEIKRNVNF